MEKIILENKIKNGKSNLNPTLASKIKLGKDVDIKEYISSKYLMLIISSFLFVAISCSDENKGTNDKKPTTTQADNEKGDDNSDPTKLEDLEKGNQDKEKKLGDLNKEKVALAAGNKDLEDKINKAKESAGKYDADINSKKSLLEDQKKLNKHISDDTKRIGQKKLSENLKKAVITAGMLPEEAAAAAAEVVSKILGDKNINEFSEFQSKIGKENEKSDFHKKYLEELSNKRFNILQKKGGGSVSLSIKEALEEVKKANDYLEDKKTELQKKEDEINLKTEEFKMLKNNLLKLKKKINEKIGDANTSAGQKRWLRDTDASFNKKLSNIGIRLFKKPDSIFTGRWPNGLKQIEKYLIDLEEDRKSFIKGDLKALKKEKKDIEDEIKEKNEQIEESKKAFEEVMKCSKAEYEKEYEKGMLPKIAKAEKELEKYYKESKIFTFAINPILKVSDVIPGTSDTISIKSEAEKLNTERKQKNYEEVKKDPRKLFSRLQLMKLIEVCKKEKLRNDSSYKNNSKFKITEKRSI